MLKNKLVEEIFSKRYNKNIISEEENKEKKPTEEKKKSSASEDALKVWVQAASVAQLGSDLFKFLQPYNPPEYENTPTPGTLPINFPIKGPRTTRTKEFNLSSGQVISP